MAQSRRAQPSHATAAAYGAAVVAYGGSAVAPGAVRRKASGLTATSGGAPIGRHVGAGSGGNAGAAAQRTAPRSVDATAAPSLRPPLPARIGHVADADSLSSSFLEYAGPGDDGERTNAPVETPAMVERSGEMNIVEGTSPSADVTAIGGDQDVLVLLDGASSPSTRTRAERLSDAGQERLDRILQEQNHAFWESARRKDDELTAEGTALSIARAELDTLKAEYHAEKALASRAIEAETAANRSDAQRKEACEELGREAKLDTLKAEYHAEKALASRTIEAETAANIADAQRKEACEERGRVKDEIRAVRRDAMDRSRRHAEDMERLSSGLCDAKSRLSEFENALVAARASSDAAHSELREEVRRHEHELSITESEVVSLQASRAELGPLEVLVASEKESAHALREELRRARSAHHELETSETGAINAANMTLAAKTAALLEEETKCASEHEAVQTARASAENACAATTAAKMEIAAAINEERREACEVATLRTALSHAEKHTALLEGSVNEMARVQAAACEANALANRLREESIIAKRKCEAEASEAKLASQALSAVKDLAATAETERLAALKRVSILDTELSAARTAENEARLRWDKERGAVALAEEHALAAVASGARATASKEEAAARSFASEAREDAAASCAQRLAMRQELETALAAHSEAWSRRDRLDAELATARINEHRAMVYALEEREIRSCEAALQAKTELESAYNGMAEAKALEEEKAAALFNEATACVTFKKQTTTARTQLLRLQELAESRLEEDLERAQELACARADATRHARSATELRAELADVRSQLSKQRYASRELEKTVEELNATRSNFGRAQRGRDTLEVELKGSKARQSLLEKQLLELQTKLTTERLARNVQNADTGSSASAPPKAPGGSADADSWLYCGPHGFFPASGALISSSSSLGANADTRSAPSACPGRVGGALSRPPSAGAGAVATTSLPLLRSQSLETLNATPQATATKALGHSASASCLPSCDSARSQRSDSSTRSRRSSDSRREGFAPSLVPPFPAAPCTSAAAVSGGDGPTPPSRSPAGQGQPLLPPRPPPSDRGRMGWVAAGAASAAATARQEQIRNGS